MPTAVCCPDRRITSSPCSRLSLPPSQLVLADKYDRFHLTYEGCRVFNPSSFRGASFGWTTYYPGTRVTESR
jgi:DNA polymerase epsilon subunit 2